MIAVKKEGILLSKSTLGFENEGVLNPATIRVGDAVHMFYRAVSKGNYSTVGYCKLSDPLTVEERSDVPIIFPQFDYESHGVEDPRITKIDNLYYLTYTAYDGINALGALATSTDLIHWDKLGLIVPIITYDDFKHLAGCKVPLNEKYARYNDRNLLHATNPDKKILLWDKNVMFFPRRINGKLYFLHRVKPDIQIACVHDLSELTKDYWENYLLHWCDNIALSPMHKHEVSYLGGGCPPIETVHGWLVIYHAVFDTMKGYVYAACAALLDLDNPLKELARLPYPLFKPEEDWELEGEVNNVCFPSGAVVFDDTLYIYYGAADERIACASMSLTALLDELLLNSLKDEHNLNIAILA
jgi:beta-1,2-mannobiose phosphorylase / 1,2-beta-oligomannan phosphorylase